MKKTERGISIFLLLIISLSNLAVPISYAAQVIPSSSPSPPSSALTTVPSTPASPPKFHPPDSGSVLGDSTSLFIIGTQGDDNQTSASQRIPLRMQQLTKKVYQTDEDVTLTVTNPDDDPFSTSVLNAKGQAVSVPVTQSQDGTTTDVYLAGSNEITPGTYTIKVTDDTGAVTTQDFSWGVLALNPDKSMYHPGDTADLSMAVLDDHGNMVCNAQLTLKITNQEDGSTNILSTTNASVSAQIVVNPQCQQHDFSLQPDYQAAYQFKNAGTYSLQLTATTQSGSHTITDTVPVTNDIPFDVQRVSATRVYPPNTYPMTINIKANRDFTGTVTETVPEDFVVTPATMSATPVSSYTNMQTVYLNTNDPAVQLQQAIAASGSGGLVMPFHGYYLITQGFGAQMTDPTLQDFYTQYGLSGHDGVDFGVPMDTPLYAVDDGNVIWSGPGDYGITIIIQHGWGQSYYGHLSTTAVNVGTHVTKGKLIGYSGESGEATGPHLHFGIRPNNFDKNNGYYGKVDPLPYLPYNNQQPQDLSTLNPTLAQVATAQTFQSVISASSSADASDSAGLSPTLSPTVEPTVAPTSLATSSATQGPVSPTLTPFPTQESQPTTTIIETSNPPKQTNFTVLDKQIATSEQLATTSQTEEVKVLTWNVTLKKGESTSIGYDYQTPRTSPQFFLVGPTQFYQNGSNKVVFQEQRQWQLANDDVGVEWYNNNTGNTWNGYSWQDRKKLDVSLNNVYATPSAQTVDFMDSGGDATGQLFTNTGGFYTSSSGTVAVDSSMSETGPDSIEFTSGNAGSGGAVAEINANGILGDAGRRISVYVNFTNSPTSNLKIVGMANSGGTNVFKLIMTSGGVLNLENDASTVLGSGGTLSTGTWYRISIAYTVTSTTVYAATVYLNGTQIISACDGATGCSGATLSGTTSANLFLGWQTAGNGNGSVMHVDDVYVDSGSDLSDTGDVHVTAKLPITSAANNYSQQGTGSLSGFTTCTSGTQCEYVNERPLDVNAYLQATTNSSTQEFGIQSASAGDVNIPSNAGLIGDQAWAYISSNATCSSGNAKIINNGVSTNMTLPTTNTMETNYASITTFPSANTTVGMTSCSAGTARTINLYEAGEQIAYIPDLTNFPVLINLSSDTDLHNHAQSGGNDILFTDSTGENLLPFEIENYTSSTGSLQAWVNISSLSTANDTIIYMYFGNPAATSLANAHGTWNGNYGAVWHFSSSGGSLGLSDSTSNGNNSIQCVNGTDPNCTGTVGTTTGQIDGAANFTGVGYLEVNNSNIFNPLTSSFSITAWINPTAVNAQEPILEHTNAGAGWAFYVGQAGCTSAGSICFFDGTTDLGAADGLTANTLSLVGVTRNGTTIKFYLNGVLKDTETTVSSIPTESTQELIGYDSGGSQIYTGIIDELKYSTITLSPGWIQTEYNNQENPGPGAGKFISILGGVETDIYAPTLSQLLRHGQFFGTVGAQSGVIQPFTW